MKVYTTRVFRSVIKTFLEDHFITKSGEFGGFRSRYSGWFLKKDTCLRIRIFCFLAIQFCMYDYSTANIAWTFNGTVFCYCINSDRRTQLSKYTVHYAWGTLERLQRVNWPKCSAVWWLGKRRVAGHVLFRAPEWVRFIRKIYCSKMEFSILVKRGQGGGGHNNPTEPPQGEELFMHRSVPLCTLQFEVDF